MEFNRKHMLSSAVDVLGNTLHTTIKLIQAVQVYGGDINQTFHLITTAGDYFIKINSNSASDMFEKEYNGLKLLRSADALHVPEPFAHGKAEDTYFLITEFIEKGTAGKNFWKTFAEGLAKQHSCSSEYFGLHESNYMGSLPQSNKQHASCAEFYAEERITPLIRLAFDKAKCDKADTALAEKFCNNLSALIPEEKPSLLHGDLWSGNFMIDINNQPVIMDPAVHYGHREADIAMTLLFGGFSNELYHCYNEILPLEKNWKQRVDLWQLYPLLVHLVLFGSSYYHRVKQVLLRYQ